MRRLAVLGTAATVLLAPLTAHAGPVCNLVTDPANDTGLGAPQSPVRTPAHDITSIDVATGKKTLVVVMRLTSTKITDDPAASNGMNWQVQFKIGTVSHVFKRAVTRDGAFTDTATQDGKAIAGLVVKADAKSITWTVPRTNVPKLKGKNVMLAQFYSATASTGLSYDYAPDGARPSDKTYMDRTQSCLRPA